VLRRVTAGVAVAAVGKDGASVSWVMRGRRLTGGDRGRRLGGGWCGGGGRGVGGSGCRRGGDWCVVASLVWAVRAQASGWRSVWWWRVWVVPGRAS